MTPAPQITELLRAWSAGDESAVGQIVELVYPELHRMAKKHLYHERPDHSIQATALVNEAYLRLVKVRNMQWKDRAHFLAMGARIMRRILIDHARSRPKGTRAELPESLAIAPQMELNLVLLDQALKALSGLGGLPGTVSNIVWKHSKRPTRSRHALYADGWNSVLSYFTSV